MRESNDAKTLVIDGKLNNPKAVLSSDPTFMNILLDFSTDRRRAFATAMGDLLRRASRQAPNAHIFLTMVPEASTVSQTHRDFYRSLGQEALPKMGEPPAIYVAARNVCESDRNCRFLDIFLVYGELGGEAHFPHDYHWNQAGHREMAEVVMDALRQLP